MAQFKARKWSNRVSEAFPFDVVMLGADGVYHSNDTFKTLPEAEKFISELENGFLNSQDVEWTIETINLEAFSEI
ncbi:MAG: hypothetical protein ACRC7W_06965 [Fusobacteriaceae bacterium]